MNGFAKVIFDSQYHVVTVYKQSLGEMGIQDG